MPRGMSDMEAITDLQKEHSMGVSRWVQNNNNEHASKNRSDNPLYTK